MNPLINKHGWFELLNFEENLLQSADFPEALSDRKRTPVFAQTTTTTRPSVPYGIPEFPIIRSGTMATMTLSIGRSFITLEIWVKHQPVCWLYQACFFDIMLFHSFIYIIYLQYCTARKCQKRPANHIVVGQPMTG